MRDLYDSSRLREEKKSLRAISSRGTSTARDTRGSSNRFFSSITVSPCGASGSGDCYLKSQNSRPVQTASQADRECQEAGLRLNQQPRRIGAPLAARGQALDATELVQRGSPGAESGASLSRVWRRTLSQLNAAQSLQQQSDAVRGR